MAILKWFQVAASWLPAGRFIKILIPVLLLGCSYFGVKVIEGKWEESAEWRAKATTFAQSAKNMVETYEEQKRLTSRLIQTIDNLAEQQNDLDTQFNDLVDAQRLAAETECDPLPLDDAFLDRLRDGSNAADNGRAALPGDPGGVAPTHADAGETP